MKYYLCLYPRKKVRNLNETEILLENIVRNLNETEILLENLGQDNILLAKERAEVVKEKKWSSQALLILEFYTLI